MSVQKTADGQFGCGGRIPPGLLNCRKRSRRQWYVPLHYTALDFTNPECSYPPFTAFAPSAQHRRLPGPAQARSLRRHSWRGHYFQHTAGCRKPADVYPNCIPRKCTHPQELCVLAADSFLCAYENCTKTGCPHYHRVTFGCCGLTAGACRRRKQYDCTAWRATAARAEVGEYECIVDVFVILTVHRILWTCHSVRMGG